MVLKTYGEAFSIVEIYGYITVCFLCYYLRAVKVVIGYGISVFGFTCPYTLIIIREDIFVTLVYYGTCKLPAIPGERIICSVILALLEKK